MKICLITAHTDYSKRKAGFHYLAKSWYQQGHDILFFTAPISHLSRLRQLPFIKSDIRLLDWRGPFQKQFHQHQRWASYIHWTCFHPVNMLSARLNRWSANIGSWYAKLSIDQQVLNWLDTADVMVFESSAAVFLFERLKKHCRQAKFIYRMSDDIRSIKEIHPATYAYEWCIATEFDLVSVTFPSSLDLLPDNCHKKVHYHGIDTAVFDQCYDNPFNTPPYASYSQQAVFVGMSACFDYYFANQAAALFPYIAWHYFGVLDEQRMHRRSNIFLHGLVPFKDTLAYLQHADIGLRPHASENAHDKHFSGSLKFFQYTYLGLPIVTSNRLALIQKENVFYYQNADSDSIQQAIRQALAFPKKTYYKQLKESVQDWSEVANKIMQDLNQPATK